MSKLTNEVQHLVKVLSWERVMDMSPLKRDVKWPDYKPRDTRSAKSRQIWIARPSTVARELKRNGSRTLGYQARYADQQAHARRWQGSRLERDRGLREQVLCRLKQGWSPEQVAGRLAMESGKRVISHESIYRFIYAQMARKKDYGWRHYLPRAKSKRGWRGPKGGSPASFMAMRRPIAERPQSAADRRTPGHWEADLMLFSTYGHAVLTMHERYSRILIALRPPGKASRPIAGAMSQVLGQMPPEWRRTVTFDNGTEFALHYWLHELGIETFFCDTHSPWQKGGVENAIGRLRRNSAPQDGLGGVALGAVYADDSGLQQYPRASAWATGLRQRSFWKACCT